LAENKKLLCDIKFKNMVKNIVVIFVILFLVFFSQQTYLNFGVGDSTPQAGVVQDYFAKGSNWVKDSMYPKISGEVQKRGEIIKNEVASEKQKISEDIGKKIKNYFSGVVDSIFNPGKLKENQNQNNCEPTDTQTQPQS
jgi:hypothetical protein